MTETANSDRMWGWLGKASVLIAVLVGGVNLYRFLLPDEASLSAYCRQHEVLTPKAEPREITDARIAEALDRMPWSPPEEERERFASRLALAVNIELGYSPPAPTRVVVCAVTNGGEKIAQDARMTVPGAVAAKVGPGDAGAVETEIIALGDLHPDQEMNVTVWHNGFLFQDDLKITHQNGRGQVLLATQVFGVLATAARIPPFLLFLILVSVAVGGHLLITLLSYAIEKTEEKVSEVSDQDGSSEAADDDKREESFPAEHGQPVEVEPKASEPQLLQGAPSLVVEYLGPGPTERNEERLTLKNVSSQPAYNVRVADIEHDARRVEFDAPSVLPAHSTEPLPFHVDNARAMHVLDRLHAVLGSLYRRSQVNTVPHEVPIDFDVRYDDQLGTHFQTVTNVRYSCTAHSVVDTTVSPIRRVEADGE